MADISLVKYLIFQRTPFSSSALNNIDQALLFFMGEKWLITAILLNLS